MRRSFVPFYSLGLTIRSLEVMRLNRERNGETVKLKYYGSHCLGNPIIRISGRGFVTYLR